MKTESRQEEFSGSDSAAHWGAFLSRRLTWVLLAGAAALGMLGLLFPLFYVDPLESLVTIEGHFSKLTYIPGPTERENVIEFSIREHPGVVWVARGIRPVDQMLFVAREKQGMFVQMEVVGRDFEKLRTQSKSAELRISPVGVKTPQSGVYLVPGDEAQVGSFNRKASALAELILGGVLFGFLLPRMRRAWRETENPSPAPLSELDPIWEWAMIAPARSAVGLLVVFALVFFMGFPPVWATVLSLLVGATLGIGYWRLKKLGFLEAWKASLSASQLQDRETHARKIEGKADRRHLKAVELLLQKAGGNVNLHDAEGRTPLWISTKAGSPEAVELLLARGADPNVADLTGGVTPLMLAAQAGNLGMALKLIARKADPLVQDKVGKRALEYAQGSEKKNPALSELLAAETRKAEIVEKQRAERQVAAEERESRN